MKRNKIMFVIAIVAMLAVLFVACDDKGNQPEHTHTYGAWNIATQPTEDAAGTATRACACGETETTTVAKLSDTTVWTVTVSQDATHETAGFKAYKSDAFGTVTLTFPKGEHVYGAWEISKEPTKENTGVAIRKCSCGHFEEATLAVLTNTSVWTLKVEGATHETTGKEIYTSEYGVVTIVTEVQQHVYGAWVDNHDGTHSRKCACGDTQDADCVYDQEVPAPAFRKSEATCTAKAVYYKSCVCGAVDKSADAATFEVGTANGHSYVGYQVTKDPTCTEAGTVTAHCETCGADYNGEIPALGHDFSGECVPYVDSSTGGYEGGDEYDEEGGSGDECIYHVHTCVRCDAKDTENKEAHDFGDAVYSLSPVHGADNMFNVNAKYSCKNCSYSKTVTDEFNRYIGQDDSWTLVEEVEADYNQVGHATWRFSDGREITVYTDKLVAPYEGTTYYYLEIRTPEDSNKVAVDGYASQRVTFDANGKATGDSGLFRGENTIRIINAQTGEVTIVRDDKGTVHTDTGSIDFVNGVIVRSTFEDWSRTAIMVPTEMTVESKDVSGSFWTDSMAFSFNAKCNLHETHTFNVFVYDGKVYYGAKFVDFEGKTVAAANCADADYVKVLDAQGNQIQAFAQKNGTLKATDGKEGVYTYEGGSVVFNGVGKAVVNGAEGVYVAAGEGASHDYDVYVGESIENATEYYRLTLGEDNACTLVKPVANFRFDSEGVGVADVEANINVVTTLPTPVREGYVFNGWKLDGEGEDIFSFKALEENGDYRFTAQWTKRTKVTVVDVKDEDKAQYSTVYIGVGNAFTTVLPAYTENTYKNGYQFVGWYLDNGDGVLDTSKDQAIDDLTTADVDGADYVVIAAWEWAGNVEFVEQSRYAWEYVAESNTWRSTNWHEKSTSSVMEVKWTSGVVRVEFDYWVDGESGSDYLTIYYYDVNGTRQSIITKSTGNVAKGNAVHVVCILDAEGEALRLSYSKDSSIDKGEDRAFVENLTINGESVVAQTSLNKNAGVYTASDDTQVRVGANGLVTIGENSYAGSVVSDNVIAITVDGVYTEVTLNTADMTCSIVEPKVNVSYNYNGHGENSTVEVGKYSNQTLSTDVPMAEGFIFRGWYTDEALATAASATFVASSDVTFYAKWDAAITLTYVYLDGTTANVVVELYANDKVETLQAVDFKFGDKVFAGWFSKDGTDTGDWGTEFVANTTLTANTTVYAKWVTPHPMMGEYLFGANLYNSDNSIASKANTLSTNYFFKVDAIGNVTGYQSGVITDYNPENGTFYVLDSNGNKFYGGFNAETKTMYVDFRAGQTGAYHDIKFAAAQIGDEVPTKTLYVGWNKGCTKLIRITYKNGDVESYRYILAYGKSIYNVTSWNATDKDDNAVTDFEKIYSDAKMLTVVYGDNTLAVGRKNDNFSALDGYQGEYTSSDGTVTLDGNGGITLPGNVTGTYTAAEEGADYTFVVKTSDKTYKLTVDKNSKTVLYFADYTVKVTFVNDLKSIGEQPVFVGIATALPFGDAVAVDGYVFRGWYDNVEFTGSAKTTVTLTEDTTYYAKYDAAVTVTFDYDGYEYETGKTTLDVTGKYVNDTLGNVIPTVASDARNNGKAFAGWFFKDGEAWGEQASSSSKLTADTVIYAKWVAPHFMAGTYKGYSTYTWTSGYRFDSKTLVIDIFGKGTNAKTGEIVDYNAETGYFFYQVSASSKYFAYYDSEEKVIIMADTSNTTSFGTNVYFLFLTDETVSNSKDNCLRWNENKTGLFTFTIGTTKKVVYVNDNEVYVNVSVYDKDSNDVDVTSALATSGSVISIKKGISTIVTYGYKDGSFVLDDGKAGTYINADAYGEIVLDGFGTLSVNGESVAYTLDGNKVTFVAGNAMRTVELSGNTYTKALDGYQGEYTLPDASKLTLDGYGNVTGTTKTYVVSGATITIYNGATEQAYGIDFVGKVFLGKSVFAGLTFSGSYKDAWDDPASFKIVFDDSPVISGYFTTNNDGLRVKFTGELNGTTLTLTMLTENGVWYSGGGGWKSDSDFNGKVVVLTVDGDTLKVTSTTIGNRAYTFKEGTAKCEGFSL